MATVPAVWALCGTRCLVCCLRRLAWGGFHGLAFTQPLTTQEFEHGLLAGVGLCQHCGCGLLHDLCLGQLST